MLMQPACAILLLSKCLVPVYEVFSFSRQAYKVKFKFVMMKSGRLITSVLQ